MHVICFFSFLNVGKTIFTDQSKKRNRNQRKKTKNKKIKIFSRKEEIQSLKELCKGYYIRIPE